MAAVAGVLISMLSLTTGYLQSQWKTGDAGRAIVIAAGNESEVSGGLPHDAAAIIMDAPGIGKDGSGAWLADAENLTSIPAHRQNGIYSRVLIRGLGPQGFKLRPELRLVSGRLFRPGAREMIVGVGASSQFANLSVGDKVAMPDGEWPIVGSFVTGGDELEGELIADNDTLRSAIKRTTYNSVLVRLRNMDSINEFKNALTANPALSVIAERHSDYYRHFTESFSTFSQAVVYAVGGILAIGALFAALNTMYAAVNARTQEIGTLRALGFSGLAVAISVLAEAVFLALAGALIGAAIAWLLFDGQQKAYQMTFYSSIFNLAVTPGLIGLGISWALAVALLGGLLPSIRAARLAIVDALRAT